MKQAGTAFSETLAEGYVIIPNVIFTGLIYQHYGKYAYLLPFILLYSFEKAGVFAIQGFESIKNPYKIVKFGLLLALLGILLTFLGTFSPVFWGLGAILIGFGLSLYSAMFRTVRDSLKETANWNYSYALIKGYLNLAIFMMLIMVLRHQHFNITLVLFTYPDRIFLYHHIRSTRGI